MYACLYSLSDKSVGVLPKSRCKLRGPFAPKGHVEVNWNYGEGCKTEEKHVAYVLKIAGKDKKAELELYADRVDQHLRKLIADGENPTSHLDILCNLSNPIETNDKPVSVETHSKLPIATKRTRKQTTVMQESLEQETEMTPKKKARKTTEKTTNETAKISIKKPEKITETDSKQGVMTRAGNASAVQAGGHISTNFPSKEKRPNQAQIRGNYRRRKQFQKEHQAMLKTVATAETDQAQLQELIAPSSPEIPIHDDDEYEIPQQDDRTPTAGYHQLQLNETTNTLRSAVNVQANSDSSIDHAQPGFLEDTNKGISEGDNFDDPYQRIRKLEEENRSLKEEVEQLRQKPVSSSDVINFIRTLLNNCESTGDEFPPFLQPNPRATTSLSIQANLEHPENKASQGQGEGQKVRLVQELDVFVDKKILRNELVNARQKGPLYLLSRLLGLVFTTEELAQSCGQGLNTNRWMSVGDKNPLDSTKVCACKDYVTAFSIENSKQQPSTKQMNETITNQVSYARVKIQRRSAK